MMEQKKIVEQHANGITEQRNVEWSKSGVTDGTMEC